MIIKSLPARWGSSSESSWSGNRAAAAFSAARLVFYLVCLAFSVAFSSLGFLLFAERQSLAWCLLLPHLKHSSVVLGFGCCLLSGFFFAIIDRSAVWLVARFAMLAASVEVTICWISSRSLPSECRRVAIISKSSCKESRGTTRVMQSQIVWCSVTADWRRSTSCSP